MSADVTLNIKFDPTPLLAVMGQVRVALEELAAAASKAMAAVTLNLDPSLAPAETKARAAAAMTRELEWIERRHRGNRRKAAKAIRRASRRFNA